MQSKSVETKGYDNLNIIKIARTEKGAVMPTKRKEDGLYDLYPCFQEDGITIQPHEIKLIPTGIASSFDSKYRIAFRERGSNSKSGLIVMSGQIDSGFRGSWFISLYNANDVPVEITKDVFDIEKTEDFIRVPYTKAICQFAVERVPNVKIKWTSYDDILKDKSQRGIGCLGSSGK